MSEIADLIGVDQPRSSRLVAQSVEQGYVERQAHPLDARRIQIVLTPAGAEFARRIAQRRERRVAEALTEFTAEERERLAELLEKLAAAWKS